MSWVLPSLQEMVSFLMHDNARPHTARIVTDYLCFGSIASYEV
jgi:hypothetical protein